MKLPQQRGAVLAAGLVVALCLAQAGCPGHVSFLDVKVTSPSDQAYTDSQVAALQALITSASAASGALAGDEFADWESARPKLKSAIQGLEAAFGPEAFNGLLKHAQGGWPELEKAGDIAKARAAYLKVSDNLAQIILVARKKEPKLAGVIVYYCSMTADPANARWIQMAPPLTNPFWGTYMLDCCREIKP